MELLGEGIVARSRFAVTVLRRADRCKICGRKPFLRSGCRSEPFLTVKQTAGRGDQARARPGRMTTSICVGSCFGRTPMPRRERASCARAGTVLRITLMDESQPRQEGKSTSANQAQPVRHPGSDASPPPPLREACPAVATKQEQPNPAQELPPTRLDRSEWSIRNNRLVVVVLLVCGVIGGMAALKENLGKLFSSNANVEGSIAINEAASPYAGYSGDDERLPVAYRDPAATVYRPLEQVEDAVLFARRRALNDIEEAGRILPQMFLARGAVVLDKVRGRYKTSALRKANLDAVIEPDRPFQGVMSVEVGRVIKFLSTIYVSPVAPASARDLATEIVAVSAQLWPPPSEYANETADYLAVFRDFKHVMLRQLNPVFTVTMTNKTDDPITVGRVRVDIKRFAAAADRNASGPIANLGTVILELDGLKRKVVSGALSPSSKIAPKDVASINIELRSRSFGAYELSLTVLGLNDEVHYCSGPFLVLFCM